MFTILLDEEGLGRDFNGLGFPPTQRMTMELTYWTSINTLFGMQARWCGCGARVTQDRKLIKYKKS